MNVVIVGFGTAGKYYLDILKKSSKIKKIFVIDKRKIKKNNFFNQTSLNEIEKKNIKINYAIICTPSGYHYEPSKFFIKKKANVLIEKPFVLKLKHAAELISLSKKKKY